ncbi:D-alanine--D-alanine ligase [Candidatus Parcubacteria bacterium]|nr:MAG: D-alanine--D-alanine ligase [Candidatus Parcubacteria bacterium]
MGKIIVGVLRGGPSREHEVSLKTGEGVLANLSPEKYIGRDIFVDKGGQWHQSNRPVYHDQALRDIDVVFNALHGEYGEDGKVQHILETFNVPYTGSGVTASALGMNKIMARESFRRAGLKVPMAMEILVDGDIKESARKIFRTMPPPWVVKDPLGGSSFGVSIAYHFEELVSALERTSSSLGRLLIEEHIKGREATCGVIDDFRGKKHYALPVIEIIPPADSGFFAYEVKYNGATRELCPANFDQSIKKEIESLAVAAHNAIGSRHYSRSDFIVSKKGIYILEINTLPGLTSESLLPKAINAVGSSYRELLDHLITLAMKR